MKILITGAEGFVGAHLIEKLLSDGIVASDIYGTYYNEPGENGEKYRINWFKCDVTAEAVMDDLDRINPDRIYHLAGQSSVGLSYKEPEETVLINVTGTLFILKWLRLKNSRSKIDRLNAMQNTKIQIF